MLLQVTLDQVSIIISSATNHHSLPLWQWDGNS